MSACCVYGGDGGDDAVVEYAGHGHSDKVVADVVVVVVM